MDIVVLANFCGNLNGKDNNRFLYLAQLLCKNNNIEVITSNFSHGHKKHRNWEMNITDYKVTQIYEPGYSKNVSLKRFYSHYRWGKDVKRYMKHRKKPDVVYCAIPSLTGSNLVARYCEKNNVRFVIDIQDLWPEAFHMVCHIPILSNLIFLPFKKLADGVYKRADKIIAVSETYKKRGLSSNRKDKTGLCVYLGTDIRKFDESRKEISVDKPEDELWIAYVGTLGHSYNIELVFDALNSIADRLDKKVVFHVYGDGPYLERFQKYAKNCKVSNVFHGRLDYPSMTAYLYKSDIAVNPIVKGAAQSIINKHADYAAAGLPVVNTQECPEYRSLIEEYACGINCGVESVEDVGNALLKLIRDDELRILMGRCSRAMAEERFDRENTYKLIVKELEKVDVRK